MRNAILSTLAVCLLAGAAAATTITVTFTDVDPADARAAAWKLAQVNEVRVAHGQEAFADIKAMIVDRIQNVWVPAWIQQEAEAKEQAQSVNQLWKDATDAQRAAAIAALQAGE